MAQTGCSLVSHWRRIYSFHYLLSKLVLLVLFVNIPSITFVEGNAFYSSLIGTNSPFNFEVWMNNPKMSKSAVQITKKRIKTAWGRRSYKGVEFESGKWRWLESNYKWRTGNYNATVVIGDNGLELGLKSNDVGFTIMSPDSTVTLEYDELSEHLDVYVTQMVAKLSCDGKQTISGYEKCEEVGDCLTNKPCGSVERMGGSFNVTLLAARNIPDLDGFGDLGGFSDPFARITLGVDKYGIWDSPEATHCPPTQVGCAFDEKKNITFGNKLSGSEVKLDIWDSDSGLEMFDDYIGRAFSAVIACGKKTTTAHVTGLGYAHQTGGGDLICSEETWLPIYTEAEYKDSAFKSDSASCFKPTFEKMNCDWFESDDPDRELGLSGEYSTCTREKDESGEYVCGCINTWAPSTTPCIKVRMTLGRYDVKIKTKSAVDANGETQPLAVVVAGQYGEVDSATEGKPYVDLSEKVDGDYFRFKEPEGGYFIQTAHLDRNNAQRNYLTFESTSDIDVWIFRRIDDIEDEFAGSQVQSTFVPKLPSWLCQVSSPAECTSYNDDESTNPVEDTLGLEGTWEKSFSTAMRMQGQSSDSTRMVSYKRSFDAGRVITVGGSMYGRDMCSETGGGLNCENSKLGPQRMYAIVVKIKPDVEEAEYAEKLAFAHDVFIPTFFRYGVPFIIFALFSIRFIQKELQYDLSEATICKYLLQFQLVETDLDGDGKIEAHEKRNILGALWLCYNDGDNHDKTNLRFRRNLFFTVQIVRALLAVPLVIWITWGAAVAGTVRPANLGIGMLTIGSAFWLCLYGGLKWKAQGGRMTKELLKIFSLSFALVISFLFLAIIFDPLDIEFKSVAAVFLTFNMIVMAWLIFINHEKLRSAYRQLRDISNKHDDVMAEIMGVLDLGDDDMQSKNGIANFVAEGFSIDTEENEMFRYSDPMSSTLQGGEEGLKKQSLRLYAIANIILLIYVLVVGEAFKGNTKTDVANAQNEGEQMQALAQWFTLTIVDISVVLLRRGKFTWGPGYVAFLFTLTRLCLAIFAGKYWLLGHGAAYFVMGLAVADEIVEQRFPLQHDEKEAGAMAYFGWIEDETKSQKYDQSGKPEFVLALLCFCNLGMLIGAVFLIEAMPTFTIGINAWPIWVPCAGLYLFVILWTFGNLTLRTYRLTGYRLLESNKYFVTETRRLPWMLAVLTEIDMLVSGALMSALTTSSLFIIVAAFFPIVIGSSAMFWVHYKENDYTILEEPEKRLIKEDKNNENKEEDEEENENGKKGFLGVAGGLFGGEGGQTFSLPPLMRSKDDKGAGFSMPSLPMKMPTLGRKKKNKTVNEEKQKLVTSGDDESYSGEDEDDEDMDEEEKERLRQLEKQASGGGCLSCIFQVFCCNCCCFRPCIRRCCEKGTPCWRTTFCRFLTCRCCCKRKIVPLDEDDVEQRNDIDYKAQDKQDTDEEILAMGPLKAFYRGKLTKHDYRTIFWGIMTLFSIFLFGFSVAQYCQPFWMGHAIWVILLVLISGLMPFSQWFNTYEMTHEMWSQFAFSFVILVISSVVAFFTVMDANLNDNRSMILLVLIYWYPTMLLLAWTVRSWKDANWVLKPHLHKALKFFVFSILLWTFWVHIWLVYGWTSVITVEYAEEEKQTSSFITVEDIDKEEDDLRVEGIGMGAYLAAMWYLSFAIMCVLFVVIKSWATNDFYVDPKIARYVNAGVMIVAVVMIVGGVLFNEIVFASSCMAICIIVRRMGTYFGTIMLYASQGCPMFISPYIFPVYVYDPDTNNVTDISRAFLALYTSYGMVIIWGMICVIFVAPMGFGLSLVSLGIILLTITSAKFVSQSPISLGDACRCCDQTVFETAGQSAVNNYMHRRSQFHIHFAEYDWADQQQEEADALLAQWGGEKSEKELQEEERKKQEEKDAMRYPASVHAANVCKLDWKLMYTSKWTNEKQHSRDLGNVDKDTGEVVKTKPKRRDDALFTIRDALTEAVTTGYGPLGWVFLFSYPYKIYMWFKNKKYRKYLKNLPCWEESLKDYGKVNVSDFKKRFGSKKKQYNLQDHKPMFENRVKQQNRLAQEFFEEMRCLVTFQILLLVASDEKLRREKVMFQKFLRENRFKLLANGIKAPPNIFSSQSHATVDVRLVATWMKRLTPEQRSRFYALKMKFSTEIRERNARQDEADEYAAQQAEEFKAFRAYREYEMACKVYELFTLRRQLQAQNGIIPDPKIPEHIWIAKEMLAEYDAGKDCLPGKYGRELQFHDPDFPHNYDSIGECEGAYHVVDWRVASGININAGLFEGGTDPDDVFQGELYDGWLLSAISILAASGGVDDNEVDKLVDNLFINKTSDCGCYAVQLYHNAQWEVTIVDDFFPFKDDQFKLEPCAGAAFAFSKDMEELWVPVLEKAFAKYYGSYSYLEHGYVQQALTDLTGGHAEVIHLAKASRGANKLMLWNNLKKWKKNLFMLGAGTVSADAASREIMDSGLIFGATYVIYEAVAIDGHHLVKLRNPPDYGHGATEWKGDWGDDSDLWNKRLMNRLNQSQDADDGCFWMSFDDFCMSFRCLYVCHVYDESKWTKYHFQSKWSNEAEDVDGDGVIDDGERGTAAGLPSKHNKDCVFMDNPHFGLDVKRPTDLCLKLSQTENGVATLVEPPHPMCVFIIKTYKIGPRFVRIRELNNRDVLYHSGDPVRYREIALNCSLKPGSYCIVCTTYVAGEESPFELAFHTNYPVDVREMRGKGPKTFAEIAQEKAEEKAKIYAAKLEAKARLELAKRGIGKAQIDKMREKFSGEKEMDLAKNIEEIGDAEEKAANQTPWTEETDKGSGMIYYYNHDTGIAVWDKPADFDPEAAAALKKKLKAEKKKRKEERRAKRNAEKEAQKAQGNSIDSTSI